MNSLTPEEKLREAHIKRRVRTALWIAAVLVVAFFAGVMVLLRYPTLPLEPVVASCLFGAGLTFLAAIFWFYRCPRCNDPIAMNTSSNATRGFNQCGTCGAIAFNKVVSAALLNPEPPRLTEREGEHQREIAREENWLFLLGSVCLASLFLGLARDADAAGRVGFIGLDHIVSAIGCFVSVAAIIAVRRCPRCNRPFAFGHLPQSDPRKIQCGGCGVIVHEIKSLTDVDSPAENLTDVDSPGECDRTESATDVGKNCDRKN